MVSDYYISVSKSTGVRLFIGYTICQQTNVLSKHIVLIKQSKDHAISAYHHYERRILSSLRMSGTHRVLTHLSAFTTKVRLFNSRPVPQARA